MISKKQQVSIRERDIKLESCRSGTGRLEFKIFKHKDEDKNSIFLNPKVIVKDTDPEKLQSNAMT